jgi:ABC-type amino acid transport system permease subunit
VSGRGLLEALGAIIALVVGTAALFRPAGESRSTGLFALLLALMVGASVIDHRSAHRSNTHNRGSKSQSELGPWYLGVAIPGALGTWLTFFYVGVRTRRGIWVLWGGIYLTAVLVVIYGLNPNAPRVGAGEGLPLGGVLLIGIWGMGILHACIIREEVRSRFLSAQQGPRSGAR